MEFMRTMIYTVSRNLNEYEPFLKGGALYHTTTAVVLMTRQSRYRMCKLTRDWSNALIPEMEA
jgi:hypothetical protein